MTALGVPLSRLMSRILEESGEDMRDVEDLRDGEEFSRNMTRLPFLGATNTSSKTYNSIKLFLNKYLKIF